MRSLPMASPSQTPSTTSILDPPITRSNNSSIIKIKHRKSRGVPAPTACHHCHKRLIMPLHQSRMPPYHPLLRSRNLSLHQLITLVSMRMRLLRISQIPSMHCLAARLSALHLMMTPLLPRRVRHHLVSTLQPATLRHPATPPHHAGRTPAGPLATITFSSQCPSPSTPSPMHPRPRHPSCPTSSPPALTMHPDTCQWTSPRPRLPCS
jgi:hypothetical protein